MVPREGLAPGTKIGVGDSAYHRVSEEWRGKLYLPTKLPEDGHNLQVSERRVCLVGGDASLWQGPELRSTHVVQSHRGTIEHLFAHLKRYEGLLHQPADSIATLELQLDAVMTLYNLNKRAQLDLLRTILGRQRHPPGSHIITPNLEPPMKFPRALKVNDAKFPQHLRDFADAMSVLGPTVHKIVLGIAPHDIFTDRGRQRGQNLFLAGNVVQVTVEPEPLGVWRLRFRVWASYKRVSYLCYARLSSVQGVVASICECKNG